MDATSERLGNRSAQLEKQINDLNRQIRQIGGEIKLPQNRGRVPALQQRAVGLLKRRKQLEAQQSRVEGHRFNVDMIAMQHEQTQTNIDTLAAIRAAHQALKQQMKQITIEGCDDVVNDMQDIVADANAISDILSGSIGGEYVDDGDLGAEFEALAYEDYGDPIVDAGQTAPPAGDLDLGLPEFARLR
jgi:charged multivesicular body protein 5